MNNIRMPYLPISGFDSSAVFKNLSLEELESDEPFIPTLKTADGRKLSHEMELILIGMGMEKYNDLFQKERILLDTFLQLDESDLQEVGITDPNDRKFIAKNLKVHRSLPNKCVIPENPIEDLKIIKNVSQHLLLLQNYCAYVELQMKKYKFTDYKINSEESACMYLKAFAETALLQSKILCNTVYNQKNYDCLIEKLLKMNNLVLPKALAKLLPERKRKWKLYAVKLMAAVGISSGVILIGHFIISRGRNV